MSEQQEIIDYIETDEIVLNIAGYINATPTALATGGVAADVILTAVKEYYLNSYTQKVLEGAGGIFTLHPVQVALYEIKATSCGQYASQIISQAGQLDTYFSQLKDQAAQQMQYNEDSDNTYQQMQFNGYIYSLVETNVTAEEFKNIVFNINAISCEMVLIGARLEAMRDLYRLRINAATTIDDVKALADQGYAEALVKLAEFPTDVQARLTSLHTRYAEQEVAYQASQA